MPAVNLSQARTAALDNTLVLGRFIRLDLKPGPSRQVPTQPEQGPAVNGGKTKGHLARARGR